MEPLTNRMAAGIVRWVRGEECGLETLVMDGQAAARLDRFIRARMRVV